VGRFSLASFVHSLAWLLRCDSIISRFSSSGESFGRSIVKLIINCCRSQEFWFSADSHRGSGGDHNFSSNHKLQDRRLFPILASWRRRAVDAVSDRAVQVHIMDNSGSFHPFM
jgi:hypothetical protein